VAAPLNPVEEQFAKREADRVADVLREVRLELVDEALDAIDSFARARNQQLDPLGPRGHHLDGRRYSPRRERPFHDLQGARRFNRLRQEIIRLPAERAQRRVSRVHARDDHDVDAFFRDAGLSGGPALSAFTDTLGGSKSCPAALEVRRFKSPNLTRAPLRVGQPGEPLYEFLVGHDRILFELRDHGEQIGVECQVFRNEEFWYSRRFGPRLDASRPSRELAIQWAAEERQAIKGGNEMEGGTDAERT
jgi:hypothetical protein